MKKKFYQFWRNSENEEAVENSIPNKDLSPVDKAMNNLIKMKEATKLLKASAPTVRKYARLGYYKEYRFGEKLVFYDKEEILNFILNRCRTIEES
jgi:predicted DNA-binding transcriptional regulator AlpA